MPSCLKIEDLATAFTSDAFPCNPLPFLTGLFEYVKENGTDAIRDDTAKAMLWIVMAQAHGQLATINLCDEWDRLYQGVKANAAQKSEAA